MRIPTRPPNAASDTAMRNVPDSSAPNAASNGGTMLGISDVLRRAPYNASHGNRPRQLNRLPQSAAFQAGLMARARHLADQRPDHVRSRGLLLLELADSATRNSGPWTTLGIRPPSPSELVNGLANLDHERANEFLQDQLDRLRGDWSDRWVEKMDAWLKSDSCDPHTLTNLDEASEAIDRIFQEFNHGAQRTRFDNAVHQLSRGRACDSWYETLGMKTRDSVRFGVELKSMLDQPALFIGDRFCARASVLESAELAFITTNRVNKLLGALPSGSQGQAHVLIDKALAERRHSRSALIRDLTAKRADKFRPAFDMLGAKPFDSEWAILGLPDQSLSTETLSAHMTELLATHGTADFFQEANDRLEAISNSIEAAYMARYQQCMLHASDGTAVVRDRALHILKEAQKHALNHVSNLQSVLSSVGQDWSQRAPPFARTR